MSNLLAKSEPQITLRQHIEDGLSVWSHLKKSFPLAPACAGRENFWRLLWLSIIMHDLGKAHSEFQKVLKGQESEWNSQRHELFSLPFIYQLDIPDEERLLILRVVAAHHRSYSFLTEFIDNNYEFDPTDFEREFAKVQIEDAISLANSFGEKLIKSIVTLEQPSLVIDQYNREKKRVLLGKQEEITDYFTLFMLMGAFHHCDHLSSAFVTEFSVLSDQHFNFLDDLNGRLIAQKKELYHHQRSASDLLGNVILTAPTGSGKTETALFWLRNQLKYSGQGRVFYILPFRASINAMFERLSDGQKGLGGEMVGMLHGNLDAYLYESFLEEGGDLRELKTQIKEIKQTFKNLQTPMKVLTPFQLLKHLFGLKGFEKGIFEWVGGHFIFDEIHAYDPEVTAQIMVLLEFLSNRMQAKIFIMTATLPTFLKAKIGKVIGHFEEVKATPDLYDAFKRHRLKLMPGLLADNLQLIDQDLQAGKSVLIVCNTVDQARNVFNQFSEKHSDLLLIHGRFAAKDRTAIERCLQDQPPKLLIGTQAIEISLDIDYDIIYTEPAPLDALIQRFGRVNRRREKAPCPCLVFKERNEKDEYIYSHELIERTLVVLQKMEESYDGIIQENELQQYIDEVYPGYYEEDQHRFDTIYELLTRSVKNLVPFEPSPEGKEAYYKQFDGVKVVPTFYEKDYLECLDRFDFIGAEQLKVSIRKGWFASLLASSDIEKKCYSLCPSTHPKAKPIDIHYLRINRYYRPNTGLELDRPEDNTIVLVDHIL